MNDKIIAQKDQFLRETERQLRMAQVDASLDADNQIHTSWNGKPLCTVDANGTVHFSPDNIRGVDEDRQLQAVTQTVAQVKEYLRIMERAPTLKAVDLNEDYNILAEFDDIVLAGRMSKNGVRFVTWEYDFDRRGVHTGHYFMQNYEGAKQDFSARSGLVNRQRLFSDEQLAVIQNACEFSLEEDITLSYAEEKLLRSVQEQKVQPVMKRSMQILEATLLFHEIALYILFQMKQNSARCIITGDAAGESVLRSAI